MQHEQLPSREIIVRGPSTNHDSVNTTDTTQKSTTNQYLNQFEVKYLYQINAIYLPKELPHWVIKAVLIGNSWTYKKQKIGWSIRFKFLL
jgi:hypothetical protein